MSTREKLPPSAAQPSRQAWRFARAPGTGRAAAALLLCLLPLAGSAAEVYRWTDAQGRVHFGDRPPDAAAERLEVPAAAPAAAATRRRHERTLRMLDAYAADREEREQSRREARTRAEQRSRNCLAARDREFRFDHASRVFRRTPNGERVVLEGQAYEDARARVKRAVDQWCDEP